ncbi:hypothetical protein GGF31_001895 [Allomyces arbusculus]|nr:hypothetical protein GGF31_001895 [Allomyces arbusculus]
MLGRRQSAPAPAPSRASSASVYASPRILQPAPPPAPAHLAPLTGTPSSSLASNGKPAKSPKKSAMARLKSRIGRNKTSPPSAPAPAPATVPQYHPQHHHHLAPPQQQQQQQQQQQIIIPPRLVRPPPNGVPNGARILVPPAGVANQRRHTAVFAQSTVPSSGSLRGGSVRSTASSNGGSLRVRMHKRPGVAIPPIKQQQQQQQQQLGSPQVRAATPSQHQQQAQQQAAQQAAYQAQQQYAQRNMAIPSPVAPPPPGPPKINWAPPNLQTPGLPPNARGGANPISPPWLRKMSSDQSMTPSMTSLMSPYGTFHPAIEFAPASSEASGPPSDDEHDDAFRRGGGMRGGAGPSRGFPPNNGRNAGYAPPRSMTPPPNGGARYQPQHQQQPRRNPVRRHTTVPDEYPSLRRWNAGLIDSPAYGQIEYAESAADDTSVYDPSMSRATGAFRGYQGYGRDDPYARNDPYARDETYPREREHDGGWEDQWQPPPPPPPGPSAPRRQDAYRSPYHAPAAAPPAPPMSPPPQAAKAPAPTLSQAAAAAMRGTPLMTPASNPANARAGIMSPVTLAAQPPAVPAAASATFAASRDAFLGNAAAAPAAAPAGPSDARVSRLRRDDTARSLRSPAASAGGGGGMDVRPRVPHLELDKRGRLNGTLVLDVRVAGVATLHEARNDEITKVYLAAPPDPKTYKGAVSVGTNTWAWMGVGSVRGAGSVRGNAVKVTGRDSVRHVVRMPSRANINGGGDRSLRGGAGSVSRGSMRHVGSVRHLRGGGVGSVRGGNGTVRSVRFDGTVRSRDGPVSDANKRKQVLQLDFKFASGIKPVESRKPLKLSFEFMLKVGAVQVTYRVQGDIEWRRPAGFSFKFKQYPFIDSSKLYIRGFDQQKSIGANIPFNFGSMFRAAGTGAGDTGLGDGMGTMLSGVGSLRRQNSFLHPVASLRGRNMPSTRRRSHREHAAVAAAADALHHYSGGNGGGGGGGAFPLRIRGRIPTMWKVAPPGGDYSDMVPDHHQPDLIDEEVVDEFDDEDGVQYMYSPPTRAAHPPAGPPPPIEFDMRNPPPPAGFNPAPYMSPVQRPRSSAAPARSTTPHNRERDEFYNPPPAVPYEAYAILASPALRPAADPDPVPRPPTANGRRTPAQTPSRPPSAAANAAASRSPWQGPAMPPVPQVPVPRAPSRGAGAGQTPRPPSRAAAAAANARGPSWQARNDEEHDEDEDPRDRDPYAAAANARYSAAFDYDAIAAEVAGPSAYLRGAPTHQQHRALHEDDGFFPGLDAAKGNIGNNPFELGRSVYNQVRTWNDLGARPAAMGGGNSAAVGVGNVGGGGGAGGHAPQSMAWGAQAQRMDAGPGGQQQFADHPGYGYDPAYGHQQDAYASYPTYDGGDQGALDWYTDPNAALDHRFDHLALDPNVGVHHAAHGQPTLPHHA